ncbi:GNAT family N-acetyltransferase [Streptococcus caprae]|uniref:GNAT family N-acetyltransferase n=1 Tax=Streptococcus caprae TaxID=1640501 RepID=A0ABV8CT17_9STRE
MELRQPQAGDEQVFLEMAQEFEQAGSRMSGAIAIWSAAKGDFQRMLALLELQADQDTIASGLGPFRIFLSWEDEKLTGLLALRTATTPAVLREYGHIGYCLRPSQRGKGLAKEQLRLGLLEAKELGMDRLLVTCHQENEASRRTILANGGQYEKTVDTDEFYWIRVNER